MTLNTPHPVSAPEPSSEEYRDRNKALLLAALRTAGATRATVGYSGGGDEGFANEVTAFNADGALIDLLGTVSVFAERSRFVDGQWQTSVVQKEYPLDDALSDFAMEAVDDHHRGWENGDGAAGEVVFDCVAGSVRIEHNSYYTESDYTETEL